MSKEKNLEQKEGFLNRHTQPLPTEEATINILVNDFTGEEIIRCRWKPFKRTDYPFEGKPAEGYLGTAKQSAGYFTGIGFHAWEQYDSEFIYYQIIETPNQ